MLTLFRAVVDRVKLMFASAAASELEAEFLARDAERRAELLRQAERYQTEGLTTVAERLRKAAESISTERPAAAALPAPDHWLAASTESAVALPPPAMPTKRKR